MRYLVPLVLLMNLCGCTRLSSNVCPKPYTFSKDELNRAAQEINLLPSDSALLDILIKENKNNDYLKGIN